MSMYYRLGALVLALALLFTGCAKSDTPAQNDTSSPGANGSVISDDEDMFTDRDMQGNDLVISNGSSTANTDKPNNSTANNAVGGSAHNTTADSNGNTHAPSSGTVLSGQSANSAHNNATTASTSNTANTTVTSANGTVYITLNGTSATATSNTVKITGSTVRITEEATYILSGTLTNGQIIVDTSEKAKPQLVLSGVSITSKTSAPLYIALADKVFITLAKGTANTLANGGSFTAIDSENIDAAIFSKEDITFNGTGTLTVTSPAGHGITGKDDVVFTGGSYTVNAASHAVDANDSVRITGATTLTLDAGKDGIHVENTDDTSLGFVYISGGTFHIEAEGDGLSAGAYMQIKDGAFTITAGGGSKNGSKQSSGNYGDFMGGMGGRPARPGQSSGSSSSTTTTDDSTSMKGFKSTGNMTIEGGSLTIDSADDGLHSNASLTVSGGNMQIKTGDDGIHAEETLTVSGGTITITESYEGLEALHIKVNGGTTTLTASDDGLNAAGGNDQSGTGGRDEMFGGGMSSGNGSITIAGGNVHITASGDGLDANGTLSITGGYTTVCGPTQGDTATLDFDKTGTISGGSFIGTGAAGGMAQTFSESEQGVISVQVGTQSAGTKVTVKDANGKTLLTYTPTLSFAVVIASSKDIVKGSTYSLTVGSQTGNVTAN